jgi:DNA-binding LytR/AlgR family response regulator
VIDDEPIGREILESFVKRINFLELVAICEDAFEALEILEEQQVDLLLSDIQMPEINGLEFVRSLPSPPAIIFITAHDQFAVNGFEIGVVDYLLKPVSFDRFLKAINKARIQIDLQNQLSILTNNQSHDFFFIKANNKLNKILFSSILYIQSMGDYIRIYTRDETVVSYSTMKAIQEKIPLDRFVRIHKSYLISIDAVKTVDGNTVELVNGTSLAVAKSRKEALFTALQLKDAN